MLLPQTYILLEEEQEPDVLDGFSDLLPPADVAFEEKAVACDVDAGGVGLQTLAELGGAGLAV